ncbi:MAG: hypothetical protein P9M07_00730 [Candidatus Aceula meridiana]|nr:hypothetical protein [Candidatus Aceula meridiana]
MKILFLLICFLSFIGCQTCFTCRGSSPKAIVNPKGESDQEVQSAIESVAGAVTQTKVYIRYCPVCGRRFSPDQEKCPYDGSELKDLKEE